MACHGVGKGPELTTIQLPASLPSRLLLQTEGGYQLVGRSAAPGQVYLPAGVEDDKFGVVAAHEVETSSML